MLKERRERKEEKTNKKNDHKNSKDISRTFSGGQGGISTFSDSFLGRLIFLKIYKAPSYVVGTDKRVLIYCTCHFQGDSLCFSFFCLLVSSVSDFCPDTRRAVVDTFFRLTCSVALWGGRDIANK